jgi:hypothetical protein
MLERHFVEGRMSEEEFDVPRRSPGRKRHAWRFWRT